MKEWWKEFELVECPSVPREYNKSRIEEIKCRLIQSVDATEWLMYKNKEMTEKVKEYDKRRSEEEASRV